MKIAYWTFAFFLWTLSCIYGQEVDIMQSCSELAGSQVSLYPSDLAAAEVVDNVIQDLNTSQEIQLFQSNITGIAGAIVDNKPVLIHEYNFFSSLEGEIMNDWNKAIPFFQSLFYVIQNPSANGPESCLSFATDADRFIGYTLFKLGVEEAILNQKLPRILDVTYYPPELKKTDRLPRIKAAFAKARSFSERDSVQAVGFDSPDLDHIPKIEKSYFQLFSHSADFPILKEYWNAGYQLNQVFYAESSWFIHMTRKGEGFLDQAMRLSDKFPKNDIEKFWKDKHDISQIEFLNGQWYLCMDKFTSGSQQLWRTRKNFPEKEIAEQWNKGNYILELSYGDGVYSLLMDKKPSGYNGQSWMVRNRFPEKEIIEYWEKDFEITELNFINGQWGLVMTKFKSRTPQKWLLRNIFPYQEVLELEDEGYYIQQISHDSKQWAIVLNKT